MSCICCVFIFVFHFDLRAPCCICICARAHRPVHPCRAHPLCSQCTGVSYNSFLPWQLVVSIEFVFVFVSVCFVLSMQRARLQLFYTLFPCAVPDEHLVCSYKYFVLEMFIAFFVIAYIFVELVQCKFSLLFYCTAWLPDRPERKFNCVQLSLSSPHCTRPRL